MTRRKGRLGRLFEEKRLRAVEAARALTRRKRSFSSRARALTLVQVSSAFAIYAIFAFMSVLIFFLEMVSGAHQCEN